MFEAHKKLNIELTSYGHCYQQLIYTNFEAGNINKEQYDKHLNVLTELAWWIFKSSKNPNHHDIDVFFIDYEEKFLSSDRIVVLESLIECSLLVNDGIEYSFKYPYIYYFFVAKKIAESYTDDKEVREATEKLLKNLHKEDFASILIFVTHHTKNSWILEKIQACLKDQFNGSYTKIELWKDQDFRKITLTPFTNRASIPFTVFFERIGEASFSRDQLKFIQNFIQKIPELVLEQREVSIERKKKNEYLDAQDDDADTVTLEEDKLSNDILSDINRVFKSMEIAGQIINNRHASLQKLTIIDLA
ncbi:hypothetical protein CAN34_13190, partial [Psychrobacter sp. DAB_AL32B]